MLYTFLAVLKLSLISNNTWYKIVRSCFTVIYNTVEIVLEIAAWCPTESEVVKLS